VWGERERSRLQMEWAMILAFVHHQATKFQPHPDIEGPHAYLFETFRVRFGHGTGMNQESVDQTYQVLNMLIDVEVLH
jgi:hypothetical protein